MSRKLLLFLTNDQLTAYLWERGGLAAASPAFSSDEAGHEAFSRHLAGLRNIPVYLLADLIEEDFQRENLPHVMGRSRNNLIQRRLGQIYRDTPYRQATPQGREEYGRKDDRMLFSALTNADLLKPWVATILKQKAPLAGIYSPALLSPFLIKKLGLVSDHLLLVTHQSGGLRQSYFQGAYLKFSRLTPLIGYDSVTSALKDSDFLRAEARERSYAEIVAQETAKTQQFLLGTRLLPRGETLNVAILADSEGRRKLEAACPDTIDRTHLFLDPANTLSRFRGKSPAPIALSDSLFLSLLGRNAPAGHYALPEQTRYFRLWQLRIALYVLSAGTVTGGLLLAGSNSLEAVQYYLQTRQLAAEAQAVQAQYQIFIRGMMPTAASPQNMKAAVEIEQMISRNAPSSSPLLGTVSQALNALPQIRIDQLQWQASEKSEAATAPADAGQPQAALNPAPHAAAGETELAPPAILVGIPRKPYQVLLLEGEVVSFGQDFRAALENVRQFAAELGKNPLVQVQITRSPFDARPAVKLEGVSGNENPDAKALFSLKLTWEPGT